MNPTNPISKRGTFTPKLWAIICRYAGVTLWAFAIPAFAAESFSFSSPHYPASSLTDLLNAIVKGPYREEISITGTLTLPPKGAGPIPAVVLLHSSAGVQRSETNMAAALNRAGIAAVYFESYSPRGVANVAEGGAPLATVNQAIDAYAALKTLAKDARIDANRIAVMGFSAGGGATILASSVTLARALAGDDGPRFASHLAFYPGMHVMPAASDYSGVPILIIHGDGDDYQLPKRSSLWVDYIKRERPEAKLEFTLQAGGKHSFMNDGLPANRYVANYTNPSNCPINLVPGFPKLLLTDGTLREATSQADIQPLMKACLTKGGSIGYNRSAAQGGMEKALRFLGTTFNQVR